MTEKELLYVEDSIGHEQNIIKICNESLNHMDDDTLITFIKQEIETHTSIKDKLINVLKEKTNE